MVKDFGPKKKPWLFNSIFGSRRDAVRTRSHRRRPAH